MGANMCKNPEDPLHHLNITELENHLPSDKMYRLHNGDSIKYQEIVIHKQNKNTFEFSLNLLDEPLIFVNIPVISDGMHKIGH